MIFNKFIGYTNKYITSTYKIKHKYEYHYPYKFRNSS